MSNANTSDNQGDHCIIAINQEPDPPPPNPPKLINVGNQIADIGSCNRFTGIVASIQSTFTFEGPISRLMDQSGSPIRGASEAVTDASGYFAFALEPETVDGLIAASRAGIFLGVFTNRRRLVYQQLNPLTLARSARLLVKISLKRLELISEPSLTPTAVIAPNLVGMTEEEALATLQEVGMQLGQRETKVAPEQAGRVLDQRPAAGLKTSPGSSVSLVIATQRDRARRSQSSTKEKR